jgi:hypothetical protein
MSTSQTDRPGTSQTMHNQGPPYVSAELIPQGVRMDTSLGGAPLLIAFTNPQQPRYGMGLTSISQPATAQLYPPQGPIDRGY